jgi:hypothetical protein
MDISPEALNGRLWALELTMANLLQALHPDQGRQLARLLQDDQQALLSLDVEDGTPQATVRAREGVLAIFAGLLPRL